MELKSKHTGKVIFAGAGPGDPDLVTVKVVRFLQRADVVLVDRLVSDTILENYVSKEAEIIFVGKQHGKLASSKQIEISHAILNHALNGKLVVRLKGGDVSVFSNILDELKLLIENQVEYEIIPGITAASGASAYSGIPLTARGYSTAVRFLTFYKSDIVDESYWKDLATTDDTLVFYMSTVTLDVLVSNLVKYQIHAEKLLAIIEQATTPFQVVHVTNLYEYEHTLKNKTYLSPTIIIIGKVVGLHTEFGWIKNSMEKQHYFKPIV